MKKYKQNKVNETSGIMPYDKTLQKTAGSLFAYTVT